MYVYSMCILCVFYVYSICILCVFYLYVFYVYVFYVYVFYVYVFYVYWDDFYNKILVSRQSWVPTLVLYEVYK